MHKSERNFANLHKFTNLGTKNWQLWHYVTEPQTHYIVAYLMKSDEQKVIILSQGVPVFTADVFEPVQDPYFRWL